MFAPESHINVVYFRMISWGSGRTGEILHLAAKHEDARFSVWVKPSKRMNGVEAQELHGLECRGVELYYRKRKLVTKPLKEALNLFHRFLESLTTRVLLVTHLGEFAYQLLLQTIVETSMVDFFDNVIAGFADIQLIIDQKLRIRLKKPRRWHISRLARDFLGKTYTGQMCDSLYMMTILQELTQKVTKISELKKSGISYRTALSREMENRDPLHLFRDLKPLKSAVGWDTVIMMVQAGLSYSTLMEVFQKTGSEGLQEFLYEKQINSEPRCHFDHVTLQKIARIFAQHKPIQSTDEGRKELGSNLDSFMIEEYPVDQISLVNPVPLDQFPVDENERDRALMEEWHEKYGQFF